MIETIRYYGNHTVFGSIVDGVSTILDAINNAINRVALGILLQVALTAPLFYLHHNLFALGFVIGFVFDRQVREVVEKVNVVYNAHRSLLEKILFFGGGSLLAVLTMPTSIVIATLYYSAQWGALLYQNSLGRQRQRNPDPAPTPLEEIIVIPSEAAIIQPPVNL
ncbi:hypothetical protein [Candidatus Protochlamydia phocaeensis]|uniref:hypothetical protein n=1 Tax=Candidatus Protochlamydia phocaeensis TaxID=1414722 RepID=UPI0008390E7B|nr:hypothetical protein [Candidatus Protochlamydia phocaeensis]